MRRAAAFLLLAGALMLAVGWLADRPGEVSITWQGWRVDTSFGMLLAGAAALAALAVALASLWRLVVTGPRRFQRWRRDRRRRRGYAALTSGLVAVAAGDPQDARRHARRADALLDEPPLTMLLAAQAAQLVGDEEEARRHFERMLGKPETEFLGLRGLISQALKSGDEAGALSLARRARALRPKTAWVQTTLLGLEARAGDWEAAQCTLRDARRIGAVPPAQAARHAAAIALERSREAAGAGRAAEALAQAEAAWKADPDHEAVAAWLAGLHLDAGRARAAQRIIEQAWSRAPRPELAALHPRSRGATDPIARVKAAERLAALAPRHPQSHLALARAAIDAQLWGEARRHLDAAGAVSAGQADGAVARLMARVEEAEKGDGVAARRWLARAAEAPGEDGWTCGACGARHARWQATCGHCGAFDRIAWSAGPRVDAPAAARAALASRASEGKGP